MNSLLNLPSVSSAFNNRVQASNNAASSSISAHSKDIRKASQSNVHQVVVRMKQPSSKDTNSAGVLNRSRNLREEKLKQMRRRHSARNNTDLRASGHHVSVLFLEDCAFSQTDISDAKCNPVLLKIDAFTA